MNPTNKKRVIFASCSLVLLIAEVLIALFVHDTFVRPYFGDVLVVILLYCMIKTVFPKDRMWLLPAIFVFACAVEFSQMIPLVSLLGLDHIPFLVTVMGTSFSWGDIVCYAAGCLFVFGCETLVRISGKDELFRLF